ncbi:hypothetical protein OD350_18130 [Clostridium beijerinckii]|uniref:hypothetical protein n=1 Tax=Clostridium beijerinckii TaxID=1520 RepID=UPI002226752F|nr:hypothetical protein [Clostridium beijerinckii]UYZ34163.1 hypothetical protein OD350_18130 [Clostridium beijerinckii]
MKDCMIYGKRNGKNFKIKFDFDKKEDYLERLSDELERKNNYTLEDVERIYIKEKVLPKNKDNNGGTKNDNRK